MNVGRRPETGCKDENDPSQREGGCAAGRHPPIGVDHGDGHADAERDGGADEEPLAVFGAKGMQPGVASHKKADECRDSDDYCGHLDQRLRDRG
jgi:hypothetical protein